MLKVSNSNIFMKKNEQKCFKNALKFLLLFEMLFFKKINITNIELINMILSITL